ncbi:hypothetical protein GBA52_000549 [Prunus armeniaca]|nr:hypothetical protein GBA52_000549 [Prunus armeniaca]
MATNGTEENPISANFYMAPLQGAANLGCAEYETRYCTCSRLLYANHLQQFLHRQRVTHPWCHQDDFDKSTTKALPTKGKGLPAHIECSISHSCFGSATSKQNTGWSVLGAHHDLSAGNGIREVMTVGHQEKWRVLMETWRVRERGPRFASLVVEYLETHITAVGCGITRKSIESPAQLHQQRIRFAS